MFWLAATAALGTHDVRVDDVPADLTRAPGLTRTFGEPGSDVVRNGALQHAAGILVAVCSLRHRPNSGWKGCSGADNLLTSHPMAEFTKSAGEPQSAGEVCNRRSEIVTKQVVWDVLYVSTSRPRRSAGSTNHHHSLAKELILAFSPGSSCTVLSG